MALVVGPAPLTAPPTSTLSVSALSDLTSTTNHELLSDTGSAHGQGDAITSDVSRSAGGSSHLVGAAVVVNPFLPTLLLLRSRAGVALSSIRLCLNARPVSVFCRAEGSSAGDPDSPAKRVMQGWADPLLSPMLTVAQLGADPSKVLLSLGGRQEREREEDSTRKVAQVFLRSFSRLGHFAVDPRVLSDLPLTFTLTQASPPAERPSLAPTPTPSRPQTALSTGMQRSGSAPRGLRPLGGVGSSASVSLLGAGSVTGAPLLATGRLVPGTKLFLPQRITLSMSGNHPHTDSGGEGSAPLPAVHLFLNAKPVSVLCKSLAVPAGVKLWVRVSAATLTSHPSPVITSSQRNSALVDFGPEHGIFSLNVCLTAPLSRDGFVAVADLALDPACLGKSAELALVTLASPAVSSARASEAVLSGNEVVVLARCLVPDADDLFRARVFALEPLPLPLPTPANASRAPDEPHRTDAAGGSAWTQTVSCKLFLNSRPVLVHVRHAPPPPHESPYVSLTLVGAGPENETRLAKCVLSRSGVTRALVVP